MQYLLPLLCAAAFLIINANEKIKIIVNKLLLKRKAGIISFNKEVTRETIGTARLKDFASIIAADTDRYRNDTIVTIDSNKQDIQDVRLREEQFRWKINSLIKYPKKGAALIKAALFFWLVKPKSADL